MSVAFAHIFILGSGGFAEELHHYLTIVHPDAHIRMVGSPGGGMVVSQAEYTETVSRHHGSCVTYLGSGKCSIKSRMAKEVIGALGPPLIMQASVRSDTVGLGTVVADAAVVAFKARIGNSVLINYGASVGHHTAIGDHSVVSPQAAVGGFCSIGSRVYIGAGAMIRESLTIGDDSTIGMGAIVTKNVPSGKIVTGVNSVRDQPASRNW